MTKRSVSLKKTIIFFGSLSVLSLVGLSLRPLPRASNENCIKHFGLVSQVVKGGGEGDIVIRLKNDKTYYYINRGIDYGLSLSELKEKLVNKNVELLTIKHWSPLNLFSTSKHISQISTDGKVIYSEL